MAFFGTGFGILLVIGLGIFQIWAGIVGIDYHFGIWWAMGALAAAIFARFMLPLTVGAFFGATDVWGYHWFVGLLIALPGLLFIVPGVISTVIAGARGKEIT